MKFCPACHKTYPADFNVCPADQTGLQNSHELQPGMIIRNKYEILDRIGIGGMGVVYRARHLTFNEICAIKIVNETIAGDTNFLQRFQTEAVVTRKLRHPNAVRVDDFDYTEDGRPFIVMELVEGKNIGEALRDGAFSVPRAVRIATQAARALGVAHKLGVVHRDIKPANIILATDEQGQETAKVLDFGIAKLREAAGDAQPGMTMTGMVVGTPLYMSPEQFMGKKAAGEIDGRTDIYSLGVVLYQMVTAQLPFDGDTPYSLMMQHMQGTVRPPHELAPELNIPESLSQVILKAIDKSRDQRFQTADELITGLDQVSADAAPTDRIIARPIGDPSPPSISASQVTSPQTTDPAKRAAEKATAPITVPQITVPQIARTQPLSKLSQAAPITTPSPLPAATNPTPLPTSSATPAISVQPSLANPAIDVTVQPVDPVLANSASQHVLVQPKKSGVKQFVALVVLILAAVLVGGVGYLKYQTLQRLRIESAVNEKLSTAPSPTLRQAALRVSISDAREVILDGKVPSKDDFDSAGNLAASVPGVTHVTNRVEYPRPVTGTVPATIPVDAAPPSSDSLISDGSKFMDDGNYAEAIAAFSKAATADPNNKRAKDLIDQATQAQKTEEKLLKNRR